MKNHKPHHYCGILVLLLAVLSVFAWVYHPPNPQRKPLPIVVETIRKMPGTQDSEKNSDRPAHGLLAIGRRNSGR